MSCIGDWSRVTNNIQLISALFPIKIYENYSVILVYAIEMRAGFITLYNGDVIEDQI